MSESSERLHGLDAVRGCALLLGVIFHATMSFLPPPRVWMVADTHPTPVLGAVFFVSHIFRMTTFFLIAGFFARMSFRKRGLRGFIADRLKRIALPLVVGWPVLFAAILLASGYAVYVATGTFPTKPPPSAPAPLGAFPLTHLWFLYLLLWLYAGTLAARGMTARLDRSSAFRTAADRVVARLAASPLCALALALPAAAALYATPTWRVWFGVPTPDSNIVPNLAATIQFGFAFGVGWLLHRQPELMIGWRRRWPLYLAAAILLTGTLLATLGLAPVIRPQAPGLAKAAFAVAYAAGVWTWTSAVIGLALRFLAKPSPVRRYIADSSYWIYLVHLPIVIVLQAWLSRFDWPWPGKFAVILGIGFALMFGSYELLVRHTFVGAVLNGRRRPWRLPKPAHAKLEPAT